MADELVVQGISAYLAKPAIRENIESVIGKEHSTAFISDVVACVQQTPALAKCTNKSILSAGLVAKSINLPLTPQLGYCYMVPYDNKKVAEVDGRKQTTYIKEAQFQMGYKGYVQLALRSGSYRKLLATDVRKGEVVEQNPFDDYWTMVAIPFEKRKEKNDKGEWMVPIIGYYAKYELNNGFVKDLYMSAEDMKAFAIKYSKAYRSDMDKHTTYSFWTTKYEDMAKKTVLRQLLSKWGLLTPELQKAYECDMAVIDENGNPEYVDNKPDDTEPTVNPMGDVIEDADFIEITAHADEVFK